MRIGRSQISCKPTLTKRADRHLGSGSARLGSRVIGDGLLLLPAEMTVPALHADPPVISDYANSQDSLH
jgi:hypothetical protein